MTAGSSMVAISVTGPPEKLRRRARVSEVDARTGRRAQAIRAADGRGGGFPELVSEGETKRRFYA